MWLCCGWGVHPLLQRHGMLKERLRRWLFPLGSVLLLVAAATSSQIPYVPPSWWASLNEVPASPSRGATVHESRTGVAGDISAQELLVKQGPPASSFSSVTRVAPQVQSPVATEASHFTEVSSQASSSTLPSVSAELGGDGLAVSGLRCKLEDGSFNCGACQTDGDCPAGQGCVANRQTRRMECMASECEEDMHCFPGFACRAMTTGNTGSTVVRRCMPVGVRAEGQSCDLEPLSPSGSCQEGLRCIQGVCGRPCQPEQPTGCLEGMTCEEGREGYGCVPDCRRMGCPGGQQCKALVDSRYQCLSEVKGQCPEVPCAQGEHCNMRLSRGHAVFWCARLCNPSDSNSCPQGEVCGVGRANISTCYRKCEPVEADACGADQVCTSVSEDMRTWGCMPRAGR